MESPFVEASKEIVVAMIEHGYMDKFPPKEQLDVICAAYSAIYNRVVASYKSKN